MKTVIQMRRWMMLAGFALGSYAVSTGVAQAAMQYAQGTNLWWNASNKIWSSTSGGPYDSVWVPGNDATFEGESSTINLATAGVVAHNLSFTTTGFNLVGYTLKLTNATPTITVGGAAGVTATIQSAITGSDGLIKSGAGKLTLSGDNTYTGVTTVTEGNLVITKTNAVSVSSVDIKAAGTLTYANMVLNRTFTGSGKIVVTANSAASAVVGSLADFTGTIRCEGSEFLINVADLTSGKLVVNGGGETGYAKAERVKGVFGELSGSVNGRLAGRWSSPTELEIGGLNTSSTFAGILRNGGAGGVTSVTKTGTGALTLTGTNTYTGGTTVKGGQLLVNGTNALAGAFTVTNSLLGGSGVIRSAVNVLDAGVLTAGNDTTVGTLAVGGNIAFTAGGGLLVNIQSSGCDVIDMDNTGGFSPANGTLTLAVDTPPDYDVPVGTRLVIVRNISGAIGGTFANAADGADFFINGKRFSVRYDNGAQQIYLVRVYGTVISFR